MTISLRRPVLRPANRCSNCAIASRRATAFGGRVETLEGALWLEYSPLRLNAAELPETGDENVRWRLRAYGVT